MEDIDRETAWWRCAYYAYLDSPRALDEAEGDEQRASAAAALRETVGGFIDGELNFGTLKYRLDNVSVENGSVFPPRSVGAILSDLALGVPVDYLEPALRRAARLPEDLGEAKGALMDLEAAMEREVSRGGLKRSQARPERWAELLSCLWHIQDPRGWPLVRSGAQRFLQERGEIDMSDPAQGCAEYAGAMRRLSELTGGGMASLEHLLSSLENGELEVPDEDVCFSGSMARARELEAEGRTDEALGMYERALSLRPRTADALLRKAALYEGRGLIMAAMGELEALVEIAPDDVPAHRRLVALYRSQNMVREHNAEVRRFKALRERKGRGPSVDGP